MYKQSTVFTLKNGWKTPLSKPLYKINYILIIRQTGRLFISLTLYIFYNNNNNKKKKNI